MKNVSETFKEAIKQYGRQIDVIIEYIENGVEKFLDVNTLFSVTPIVNSNLLKSVMKQLDFESSVKVPKDTWINVRFGVLIEKGLTVQEVHQMRVDRLNSTEVRMLQSFEYINLGKYLVAEEPEYNADTLSYSHKCYDKMIYAMTDYENLNITYPITIKNYLKAIANKLKIAFNDTTFYNQNREIQNELYEGLGYTYRDVLDEIAQATGSIICINDNNKLEVRYLNNTNETIDEDLLKDVNVTMKEKYGAINTIVLSRSAGADNIYYPETLPENPVEIKIEDNQIMNWNDRSDYLPELYQALNGIEYYVNDFKSTGITYLEVGDKYNIQIGENTYNCVLLNDEIDITQGLEEQIYTDMPEQSETDYTKADKTDRKINQTNLILDKQNQIITATVSRVDENEENISNLQVDVNGIHTEVRKKVGEDEIISKINQSAEAVTIDADKISLGGKFIDLTADNIKIYSDNFTVDSDGDMYCNDAIMNSISINNNNFTVDSNGNMACKNANIEGKLKIGGNESNPEFLAEEIGLGRTYIFPLGLIHEYDMTSEYVAVEKGGIGLGTFSSSSMSETATITNQEIRIPTVTQTSREEDKKNFEKYNNALDIIKNIDIYKYNLKTEEDGTKKHIGFVIGKDFNYSEEVTSKNNDGVDVYSFVSLCCQAIKELQEEIEELKKKGDIE